MYAPKETERPLDLKQELERLIDALTDAGVDFGLCGGIAVTIHGAPRFTKDIDLLVSADDLDRALAAAKKAGFTLAAGPMTFEAGTPRERSIRRVSKPEGTELLTLDLILVSPALEDVWAGRMLIEWEGRRVPVVSRDGLVSMKRMAGRPIDLQDIEALEAADGRKKNK